MALFIAARRFASRGLEYVNVPLILSSTGAIPPGNSSQSYAPGDHWKHFPVVCSAAPVLEEADLPVENVPFNGTLWFGDEPLVWKRCNFFLSVALCSGLAITSLIVFLAFSYPGVALSWWGNKFVSTTADYKVVPLLTVPYGTTLGPNNWL